MSDDFDEKIEKIRLRAINYNTDNMVVVANDMVRGISALSLNEHKLLRLLITQIRPEDEDLYTFTVKTSEFADLLGVQKNNLYSELDRMTTHLMSEVIKIGDGNPKHYWKKFHWVDVCEYNDGVMTIKLSRELKPYVIGLQKWYTQYRLEEIVKLKSVYSIRIFELLQSVLMDRKPYGDKRTTVYIDIKTIRKTTGTEDKYERISQFREKVIDLSIRDINELSSYHIEVEPYREHRKIVGFYFYIMSQIGYKNKVRIEEKQKMKQMSFEDYINE